MHGSWIGRNAALKTEGVGRWRCATVGETICGLGHRVGRAAWHFGWMFYGLGAGGNVANAATAGASDWPTRPGDWLWWGGGLAVGLVFGVALGLSRLRRHELRRERAAQQRFHQRLLDSQEKERRRIASELHDSLGQNLLIIRNRALLGLEGVDDAAAVKEQLEEISRTALVSIEECRQIAHNLSTSHLEHLGLTCAVGGMLDRVTSSAKLHCERKLETVDDLFTLGSAIHFYRIAQEALNNVIKHARASLVQVELIRDVHHVQLVVQDNGQGFRPLSGAPNGSAGGMGLTEMTERARLLGGTLELRSAGEHGTRLVVTLPIKEGAKL